MEALMLLAVAATPITTTASGCTADSVAEVRRILSLELKQPVQSLPTNPQTLVALDCHDAAHWVITLESPGHAPAQLTADLAALSPIAQPRAVALMVAEALGHLPELPVVEASDAPARPADEVPAPRGTEVGVLGVARVNGSVALWGGGVAITARLWRWLGLRVDAAFVQGSAARESGTVFATTLDGGATLDARVEATAWLLRVGLGLRAGRGSLEGRPSSGNVGGTVVGLLWGPQVAVGGAWRPSEVLSLSLGAEAGLWAPRLEGRVLDETAVQLGGFFVNVWVQVGLRW